MRIRFLALLSALIVLTVFVSAKTTQIVVSQPSAPGIYVKQGDGFVMLQPVEPQKTDNKIFGSLKGGLGFGGTKMGADVPGEHADLRLTGAGKFYFFGKNFNPESFLLGRLDAGSEGSRRLNYVNVGKLGPKLKFEDSNSIDFRTEKDGEYNVVSVGSLTPGEYVFVRENRRTVEEAWEFGVGVDLDSTSTK